MRVPVYEERKVGRERLSAPAFDVKPADGSKLGAALEQLGAGLASGEDRVTGAITGAYQRMQEKSDHVAAANASSAFLDSGTGAIHGNHLEAAQQQAAAAGVAGGDDARTVTVPLPPEAFTGKDGAPPAAVAPGPSAPPLVGAAPPPGQQGFLATRGETAAQQSLPVLENLEKQHQALRNNLKDGRQRELFDEMTAPAMRHFRQTIEDHTTQQLHVAQEASVIGQQEASLTAIANDAGNDTLAAQLTANTEKSIRALQLSPADGDAKVQLWEQKVAETRLNQFLAEKNWRGATTLWAQSREALGTASGKYLRDIQTLQTNQQAEDYVRQVVKDATGKNGRIDADKALAALDDAPELIRDEVRQRGEHRVALQERQWTQKVDDVFNHALSAYEAGGPSAIPAQDKAWMLDPGNDSAKKWHELQQIIKADKEHARGAPPSPQQERDMAAFRLWAADHPDEAAQMTADEFNSTWLPRLGKRDREPAAALLAGYHAQANKPEKEANAIDMAVMNVGGPNGASVFPGKDREKYTPEQLDLYSHVASTVQSQATLYKRSTGGKEPTPEQLNTWVREQLLAGTNPGSGYIFDDRTTRAQAEMEGKPFAPKWTSDQKAAAARALQAAGAKTDEATVERYLRLKHGFNAPPVQRTEPEEPVMKAPPTIPRQVKNF